MSLDLRDVLDELRDMRAVLLCAGLDLSHNPEKHIKGAYALDAQNRTTDAMRGNGVKFCAYGLLEHWSAKMFPGRLGLDLIAHKINAVFGRCNGLNIQEVNDYDGITVGHIVQIYATLADRIEDMIEDMEERIGQ